METGSLSQTAAVLFHGMEEAGAPYLRVEKYFSSMQRLIIPQVRDPKTSACFPGPAYYLGEHWGTTKPYLANLLCPIIHIPQKDASYIYLYPAPCFSAKNSAL